jgi:hypothetical protein
VLDTNLKVDALVLYMKGVFQNSQNVELLVKEKDDIVTWLFRGDPNSRHESFRARRCPDTGEWFLEKFKEWIITDSKLLLCDGKRM